MDLGFSFSSSPSLLCSVAVCYSAAAAIQPRGGCIAVVSERLQLLYLALKSIGTFGAVARACQAEGLAGASPADPSLVVIHQQVPSEGVSLLSAFSQQLVGTTLLECHPHPLPCHVRLPCPAQSSKPPQPHKQGLIWFSLQTPVPASLPSSRWVSTKAWLPCLCALGQEVAAAHRLCLLSFQVVTLT